MHDRVIVEITFFVDSVDALGHARRQGNKRKGILSAKGGIGKASFSLRAPRYFHAKAPCTTRIALAPEFPFSVPLSRL